MSRKTSGQVGRWLIAASVARRVRVPPKSGNPLPSSLQHKCTTCIYLCTISDHSGGRGATQEVRKGGLVWAQLERGSWVSRFMVGGRVLGGWRLAFVSVIPFTTKKTPSPQILQCSFSFVEPIRPRCASRQRTTRFCHIWVDFELDLSGANCPYLPHCGDGWWWWGGTTWIV